MSETRPDPEAARLLEALRRNAIDSRALRRSPTISDEQFVTLPVIERIIGEHFARQAPTEQDSRVVAMQDELASIEVQLCKALGVIEWERRKLNEEGHDDRQTRP